MNYPPTSVSVGQQLAGQAMPNDGPDTLMRNVFGRISRANDHLSGELDRLGALKERVFGSEPANAAQAATPPKPSGAAYEIWAALDDLEARLNELSRIANDLDRIA